MPDSHGRRQDVGDTNQIAAECACPYSVRFFPLRYGGVPNTDSNACGNPEDISDLNFNDESILDPNSLDSDCGGLDSDHGGLDSDRGGSESDSGGSNSDRGGSDSDSDGLDSDRGGLDSDHGGLDSGSDSDSGGLNCGSDSDRDDCGSDHSDIEDSDQEVDENMFEPIYDGANITVCGAYCAIMEFKRVCRLPFTAIAMLLQLLQLLCPAANKLPRSVYVLKKFFQKHSSPHIKQTFCSECHLEMDQGKCTNSDCQGKEADYLISLKPDRSIRMIVVSKCTNYVISYMCNVIPASLF